MPKIGVTIVMVVLTAVPVQAAYVSSSRISRICDTSEYHLQDQSERFDYDSNGELGISDVMISLRIANGIQKKESYSGKIFDLDGDGKSTSSDARILLVCRDSFLVRIEQQQSQGGVQTAFRPSVEKNREETPVPVQPQPVQPQQQSSSAQTPQPNTTSADASSVSRAYLITSGPCEGRDYTKVQSYDYNNDGFIDQYDQSILQDVIAQKRKAGDFSDKVFDINRDGIIHDRDGVLFAGCGVASDTGIDPSSSVIPAGYCKGRSIQGLEQYDYTDDGVLNEADVDIMINRIATQRASGAQGNKQFDIDGSGENFEDIRLYILCALPYDAKARAIPTVGNVKSFVCEGKNVSATEKAALLVTYDFSADAEVNGYDVYTVLGVVISSRSEYALRRNAQIIADEKKRFDINSDGILDIQDVALLARCSLGDH